MLKIQCEQVLSADKITTAKGVSVLSSWVTVKAVQISICSSDNKHSSCVSKTHAIT